MRKVRGGGGGKQLYLYIVKIGNFPEILMSSLNICQNQQFLIFEVSKFVKSLLSLPDMGMKMLHVQVRSF